MESFQSTTEEDLDLHRIREQNQLLKDLLSRANQELKAYQMKYPSVIKGNAHERVDTFTPLLTSYEKSIKDLQTNLVTKATCISELESRQKELMATIEQQKKELMELDFIKELVSQLTESNHALQQCNTTLQDNVTLARNQLTDLEDSYSSLSRLFDEFRVTSATRVREEAQRASMAELELKRLQVELARKEEKYIRHKEQLKLSILDIKKERDASFAREEACRQELHALLDQRNEQAIKRKVDIDSAMDTLRRSTLLPRVESFRK